MTFEAGEIFGMMTSEKPMNSAWVDNAHLIGRATRLHELIKLRDRHFRRSIMADGAMSMMLSLFLAELKEIDLTPAMLSLVNMMDDDEANNIIESLIHAGLAVTTGENPERRLVGLTALGSARMRSFVSDFPEV